MKKHGLWVCIKVFAVVSMLILTVACAPFAVHEFGLQDNSTKYSIMKSSLPVPEQGMSRLFIYLITGGPSGSWVVGIGPAMNGFCTIDDNVYEYLGGSYFYVDLPVGTHIVTAFMDMKSKSSNFHRGQNAIEINLKSGDESYVRIDLNGIGLGTTASPLVVERKMAEEEIAPLRMAKDYKTKYTIDH